MKKRLISVLLLFVMIFGFSMTAHAAEPGNYVPEAEELKLLGVFQGTDAGFELTREPTRLEGLVMLIRLLGKEPEAKDLANQDCVFTDIPTWGIGYANYAYKYGLTNGIGNNLFGTADKMNALSYTTFMLRALGYSDSSGDFTYPASIEFAEQIGLYSEADAAELTENTFLRDQVARVSVLALGAKVKIGSSSLLDKLVSDGAISEDTAANIDTESSLSLKVHFLDVGQADSIFITKGSEAMLIDGGNGPDSDKIITYIKSQGVSTLKYIIATHPHEDHIGGLAAVIQSFTIENVIMPDVTTTTQTFEDLLTAIKEKGLTITRPVYGDKYEINGAAFTILAPNNNSSYCELNDYSVVIKLVNGSNSFLFTGDAEEQSESEMLFMNSSLLESDVLKVGHHGSSGSTSQAFLDAVNPAYAVISVGADNTYGHPAQTTLDKVAAKGVSLFRTDQQGDIIATSNGNLIVFNTKSTENSIFNNTPGTEGENKSIMIGNVDKKAELVTITNTGTTDVNLAGWVLLSVTGNQSYTFQSTTLEAGKSLTVASGGATGDIIWTAENIWNNSSRDPAQLYDSNGNLIGSYAS